jgi:hypothetical protein
MTSFLRPSLLAVALAGCASGPPPEPAAPAMLVATATASAPVVAPARPPIRLAPSRLERGPAGRARGRGAESTDEVLELATAAGASGDAFASGSSIRALRAAGVAPALDDPGAALGRAACLLEADLGGWSGALTSGEPGACRERARQLLDRVRAELRHRGLANAAPMCSDSTVRQAEDTLRPALGPPPGEPGEVLRYQEGLERLARQLERGAGLPPAR